jgi:uncharacterized membrane protein YsdA (DUF1294 family)
MEALMQTVGLYLCILNLATMAAFWWDKHCARSGLWRVSEGTLLMLALMGGTVGAIAAQHGFRHKTRKEPFRTMLYIIAVLHLGAVAALGSPTVRNALWSQTSVWLDTQTSAGVTNPPCQVRVVDMKRSVTIREATC